MPGKSHDDIADVVEPLLEVSVFVFGQYNRVFVQQPAQRGRGGNSVLADPVPDFVGKCTVPQNCSVDGEDCSLFGPDLGSYLPLQCAELRAGFIPGGFVICQFGSDFRVGQGLTVGIHKYFVNHVSRANGNARRNSYSTFHNGSLAKMSLFRYFEVLITCF